MTALAGMAFGRPSDTNLEGWFHLAVQMDQNRAADEAFHVSHRQPYIPTPAVNRPLAISRPAPAAPAPRFAHSNLSPGNPIPMDIDMARKTKATPDTCRRCGKKVTESGQPDSFPRQNTSTRPLRFPNGLQRDSDRTPNPRIMKSTSRCTSVTSTQYFPRTPSMNCPGPSCGTMPSSSLPTPL